jgi:hypothetical protein
MGEGVEYHTLYGVDRTRLTTRIPITVLGKDSQYGRILCGMCCQMSGPERSSRRSDSSSLDCTYKGSSPGQSVEPDTGQEWQPTTHRSHGDSAAIDDSTFRVDGQVAITMGRAARAWHRSGVCDRKSKYSERDPRGKSMRTPSSRRRAWRAGIAVRRGTYSTNEHTHARCQACRGRGA